ncbi:MAG: ABC transporter ATP-binding protein [Thermodesulfobacteriota bacterium]
MKAILEVRNLTKAFGGLVAVRALDFVVYEGEILGLIGPNGSGKTTSFNLISGFLRPDAGEIRFNGRDIAGLKPHKVCQMGLARTFQLTRPFAELTALQNVMIGRMYGGDPVSRTKEAERECEAFLEFVGLGARAKAPASSLGQVERKRLEVARALATRPKLLLLDEMMSGLNPAEMDEAIGLVRAIAGRGITLMVVEHVMKAIKNLSRRLLVLNYGEKIAEGDPGAVLANPMVVEAYLGE